MIELERKFLVKELPNLSGSIPIQYKRYYLSEDIENQVRMQQKNEDYEIETKTRLNDKEYEKAKEKISKERFIELSQNCSKSIIRESYQISERPDVSIKIYKMEYDGLVRVEVEFEDMEEYNSFQIPNWFGKEITNTKLGLDAELIKLNREEFLKILNEAMEV